jgi:hypothetical protein
MLFWEDRWINGESVIDIAPCLYYLVLRRIRQQQSICDGLQNRNWARNVSGGMHGLSARLECSGDGAAQ